MSDRIEYCRFCISIDLDVCESHRITDLEKGDFSCVYFVRCEQCHAQGPSKENREEAIKIWNKVFGNSYSQEKDSYPFRAQYLDREVRICKICGVRFMKNPEDFPNSIFSDPDICDDSERHLFGTKDL